MSVAGGVEYTRAGIGHVGDDADELQAVHEADGLLARAFEAEGDDTARTTRQVFLCQGVVGIVGQTAIVDLSHLVVLAQPLGYALGILAMALHAEV